MPTLFHHTFCPHSRFVRLALGEHSVAVRLIEERTWERRHDFLVLNPAGTTPVLIDEGQPPIPGAAIIAEYLDEMYGSNLERPLLPGEPGPRVEVRRLMSWFNDKFFAEVSGPLVTERFYKRHMPVDAGGGAPDTDAIRSGEEQHPLSYRLYRLAGARARLACRRSADLRRSCRCRAPVRGRLSGRCAVERRRSRQELVRAGEVATLVPSDPGRDAGRHSAVEDLRGSRLLNDPAALKTALIAAAREHSFDVVGITRPDSIPQAAGRLQQFLAEGAHGDMDWLASTAERRGDPRAIWPEARSVIMVGMNYGPAGDPLAILQQRSHGAISVYAQGDDYHEIIKPRLKALARWLIAQAGGDVKVFVDTAAVMEKPLAEAAGLGWQGKHTNLVSRQHGSWLFLGAIFTTLDLPPDTPDTDHCGTCHKCLDICPTAAFPAPYRLDARRCISYLTIEHKGPIARELRPLMGNRIYGCDDCLAVCPWNKYAQAGREAKLAARETLAAPALSDLARLDDAAFRKLFAKSPVKRIGRDRFLRNVLIAIGNSGDVALADDAERLLADASPLVRGAAVVGARAA